MTRFNGTAKKVVDYFGNYNIKYEGTKDGCELYRANRPWSSGDMNSMSLQFCIKDSEHGWYNDYQGRQGSLYELAREVGIEIPSSFTHSPPPIYDLESYAKNKGVNKDVFLRAGWVECKKKNRPAVKIPTQGGDRFRFFDNQKPKFQHYNHHHCFYKLEEAIGIAHNLDYEYLVFCNGEPSTVVAQHFRVPAFCCPGGENKALNLELIEKLKGLWDVKIIIALDNDNAGLRATLKKHEEFTNAGFEVLLVDFSNIVFWLFKGYDLGDLVKEKWYDTYTSLISCDEYDLNLVQRAINVGSGGIADNCMTVYRELVIVKQNAIRETKKEAIGNLDKLKAPQMEAELIGALFAVFDPVLFDEIDYLKSSDLTNEILSQIYLVMRNICNTKHHNLTVDPTTIYEVIKRKDSSILNKKFQSKDDLSAFISNLVIDVGVLQSEQIKQMATIIKEYSNRRQLTIKLKSGMDSARELKTPLSKTIKDIEIGLNEIALANNSNTIIRNSDVEADRYIDKIEEAMQAGGALFFPLPLRRLNAMLNGLQKGEFSLFAGEAGMGKTAWMVFLAVMGAMQGKRSLIFSLEMPAHQLMHRFISLISAIQNNHIAKEKLKLAKFSDDEFSRVIKATSEYSRLPLILIDRKDMGIDVSVAHIRNLTKKTIIDHGHIDLVAIDSLRKIDFVNPKMSNVEGLPTNVLRIEAMTKELMVHTMVLHHVRKGSEHRAGKRPTSNDLEYIKDQDPDQTIFIFRPGKYDDTITPSQTEFLITKNRDGKEGIVNAFADLATGKFSDAETVVTSLGY